MSVKLNHLFSPITVSSSVILERGHKEKVVSFRANISICYFDITFKFYKKTDINVPKTEGKSILKSDKENDTLMKKEAESKTISEIGFPNDFCHNLSTFQQKENYTDVTIRCDTETFKAHKVILSARSPVFDAMFQNTMKETLNQVVEIKDMTPEVFRSILAHIYSNKTIQESDSMELVIDILAAADKYMLQELKSSCVERLKSSISLSNAFQILSIADMYDTGLKENVVQFICTEYDTLRNSAEWKELQKQKSDLVFDIMSTKIDLLQKK